MHRLNHLMHCLKMSALLCAFVFMQSACSHKPVSSLDTFADSQKSKLTYKDVYDDANFIFSATLYFPTTEDVSALKQAWIDYGNAFPQSKAISSVQSEVQLHSTKTVLIALFMTEYDNADLKNKTLGWAVGPSPMNIEELTERDVPLRTLMPVRNDWARYFLIRYPKGQDISQITVSNRFGRVQFQATSPPETN